MTKSSDKKKIKKTKTFQGASILLVKWTFIKKQSKKQPDQTNDIFWKLMLLEMIVNICTNPFMNGNIL